VGTLRVIGRSFVVVVLLTLCLFSVSIISSSTLGSNFATHGGLAESTFDNEFFVAGSMLADLDHFLPPGVPQTDSVVFTSGLVARAWSGSLDLRYFAMGWVEHLEQDSEFGKSVANIQAVHPGYTDADIRLGFDYLSINQHPTDVNVTFIMSNTEIVEAIRAGFTNITSVQIQQAIWDYVVSESIQSPGYLAQMQFAQVFAFLYPEKIAGMQDEYNSYAQRVTRSIKNPFLGEFSNLMVKGDINNARRGDPPVPKVADRTNDLRNGDSIPTRETLRSRTSSLLRAV
jgi:hypothetical protein